MKYVLAVVALCLCLAGCQVAEPHRGASFDYSNYTVGYLWLDVPHMKWPSMFDENEFYTCPRGFAIWPTHHTGVLASYQTADDLNISYEGIVAEDYLINISYDIPHEGIVEDYLNDTKAGDFSGPLFLPRVGLNYDLTWDLEERQPVWGPLWPQPRQPEEWQRELNWQQEEWHPYLWLEEWQLMAKPQRDTHFKLNYSFTPDYKYKLWENVVSRVEYLSTDDEPTTNSAIPTTNLLWYGPTSEYYEMFPKMGK